MIAETIQVLRKALADIALRQAEALKRVLVPTVLARRIAGFPFTHRRTRSIGERHASYGMDALDRGHGIANDLAIGHIDEAMRGITMSTGGNAYPFASIAILPL